MGGRFVSGVSLHRVLPHFLINDLQHIAQNGPLNCTKTIYLMTLQIYFTENVTKSWLLCSSNLSMDRGILSLHRAMPPFRFE